MWGNLIKLAGISSIYGTYYYFSHYNQISLTNPHLAQLLTFVHSQNPQYSITVFKILLKSQLLEKDQRLNNYFLGKGFDYTGKYISEINKLGFRGLEVGPVALNSSIKEEAIKHLGIKYALSYICSYKDQHQDCPFQISLNVAPNYQVLKFAPYLLQQNILQSIDTLVGLQKRSKVKIVNRIVIEFDRNDLQLTLEDSLEARKLKEEIRTKGKKAIQQLSQQIQSQIKIDFMERSYTCLSWDDLLSYIKKEKDL